MLTRNNIPFWFYDISILIIATERTIYTNFAVKQFNIDYYYKITCLHKITT